MKMPLSREVLRYGDHHLPGEFDRSAEPTKSGQPYRLTSLDNWRVALQVHVIPRLGSVKVSDVRPEHVERLYLDLTQHGKAQTSAPGGVRSPRPGRKPSVWTQIDRDYETLRIDIHALFDHLGISIDATAA